MEYGNTQYPQRLKSEKADEIVTELVTLVYYTGCLRVCIVCTNPLHLSDRPSW